MDHRIATVRLLSHWLQGVQGCKGGGGVKRIQSILSLPQQAAVNLDMALGSPHCHRERFTVSSGLALVLCLLSFIYLCPFLSPASSLRLLFFNPCMFFLHIPVSLVSLPHCYRGTHIERPANPLQLNTQGFTADRLAANEGSESWNDKSKFI